MKLFLCEKCADVVSLRVGFDRSCDCGQSGGRYVNNLDAEVWGPCMVLGFANSSLTKAYRAQKHLGDSSEKMMYDGITVAMGRPFDAFIIPESANSIKRIERNNHDNF